MEWNGTRRWLLFTRMSFVANMAMAVGKLLLGAFTLSAFLCIHGLYSAGLAAAKGLALKGHGVRGAGAAKKQKIQGYCRCIGVALALCGLAYMAYCLRMFAGGMPAQYPIVVSIGIAAATFGEIGMAAYGMVAARKLHDPIVAATKRINFCSALISLAFTQSALLSAAQSGDVWLANVVMGLACGGIVVLLGIFAMVRARPRSGEQVPYPATMACEPAA